jgi:hypothetical protein
MPISNNIVIGSIEVKAQVTCKDSDITNIKFFMENDEIVDITYNPEITNYSCIFDQTTLENTALFWNIIKVSAYSGEEEIESKEIDVFAIIKGKN